MPNGTYGGVRGKETKVGQKTFVSRPTRFFRQENNISSKLKQLVPKQLKQFGNNYLFREKGQRPCY